MLGDLIIVAERETLPQTWKCLICDGLIRTDVYDDAGKVIRHLWLAHHIGHVMRGYNWMGYHDSQDQG